jgi:hypothetical protein
VSPIFAGVVVAVALIVVIMGVWLLTRNSNPPKPPGRHQQPRRDPHDPVVPDNEEPPDQP